VRRRQMAVAILDFVQVLEKEIAASRRLSEQRLYFGERRRLDGTTLERPGAAFAPTFYIAAFQYASSRITSMPTS
jgi:hypothetical protein